MCSAAMVEFVSILVIVKFGCILVARHRLSFLRHYCLSYCYVFSIALNLNVNVICFILPLYLSIYSLI